MRDVLKKAVNEVRGKLGDVYILGLLDMPKGSRSMTFELYSNDGRFSLTALSADERTELLNLYVELRGVHGLP